MSKIIKKFSRAEGGTSLVEFALTTPFLLLLIMGFFDLGWAVYANNTVSLAAREGARVGIICTKTDAEIRDRVKLEAQGLNLTDSQITIAETTTGPCADGGRDPGSTVQVTVSYSYTPVTPLIANWLFRNGGSLVLRSSATMYVE